MDSRQKTDKHSTGGVGDKPHYMCNDCCSLDACKMSGRDWGTQAALSINLNLSPIQNKLTRQEFIELVKEQYCHMCQSESLRLGQNYYTH